MLRRSLKQASMAAVRFLLLAGISRRHSYSCLAYRQLPQECLRLDQQLRDGHPQGVLWTSGS